MNLNYSKNPMQFERLLWLQLSVFLFACNAQISKEDHRTKGDPISAISEVAGGDASNSSTPTPTPSLSNSLSPSLSPSFSPSMNTNPSPSLSPTPSPSSPQAGSNSIDQTAPIPGAGGAINATNVTTGGLILNWTEATDNKTSPNDLSYSVFQLTAANVNEISDLSDIVKIEAEGLPLNNYTKALHYLNVIDLNIATSYYFVVVVKDISGNKSAYQALLQSTSSDTVAPVAGASGSLTTSNIASTHVNLSWAPAVDNYSNQANMKYLVFYSPTNNLQTVQQIETNGTASGAYATNISSTTVADLIPGNTYYFNVITKDESGNKTFYTTTSAATTPDTIAPFPGSAGVITLSGITPVGLTLNWSTATDNTTSQTALSYEVRRSSSNNMSSVSSAESSGIIIGNYTQNVTSKVVTGLITDTSYFFTVIVKDLSGNKSIYGTVSMKPVNKQVASDGSSTCVISSDSTMHCFGHNDYGQLGYDDTLDRGHTPGSISGLAAVNLGTGRTASSVYMVASTTCAILDNGALKCWGKNNYNQLGYGDTVQRGHSPATGMSTFQGVNLGTGRTAVAMTMAQMSYSPSICVILDTGNVKCWGGNYESELGYDDTTPRWTGLGASGIANLATVNLGTGRTAKKIGMGGPTCALLDNDKLKCWGKNNYGALGQNDTNDRGAASGAYSMTNLSPIDFGAGRTVKSFGLGGNSCAILDDDSLKCWGFYGTAYHDNVNRGGGTPTMANLPAVNLGSGRKAVALSTSNSHLILDDGSLILLGREDNPINLGAGRTPISMSTGTTSCVVLDDYSIKCWGSNYYGELGQEHIHSIGLTSGTMSDLNAINLGAGKSALAIPQYTGSMWGDHMCAILKPNNGLKCWGFSSSGQLGYDDAFTRGSSSGTYNMANLPEVNLGTNRSAKAITIGLEHTCVILDDNTLKCWGGNDYGQLGLDDTVARGLIAGANGMANLAPVFLGSGRTAKKISAGEYSTCAILDNDSLKCWGNNTYGQLGLDDVINRGDTATTYDMASLPAVYLGAGRKAKEISSSTNNTCAILDNDALKCWGYSGQELGQEGFSNWGSGVVSSGMAELQPVNFGSGRTVKAISKSLYYSCVILDTNELKCWGSNSYGNLGYDDFTPRYPAAGLGLSTLGAVNLGTNRTAIAISAGNFHACAILDNYSLKCWGDAGLGYDDRLARGGAPGTYGMANLPTINLGIGRTAKSVAALSDQNCVILDNDQLKCFGDVALGYDGALPHGIGWPMSMALPVMLP